MRLSTALLQYVHVSAVMPAVQAGNRNVKSSGIMPLTVPNLPPPTFSIEVNDAVVIFGLAGPWQPFSLNGTVATVIAMPASSDPRRLLTLRATHFPDELVASLRIAHSN